MTRSVDKTVTTDADGRTTTTKTIHKDRPKKTVDKVIQKEVGGDAGPTKTKTKTVRRK